MHSNQETSSETIAVFDLDAAERGGYVYTTDQQPSSRMATQTTFDLIVSEARFSGRAVLDMGCGDGFFTLRLWDHTGPYSMVAVDASSKAIEVAISRKEERNIRFEVGNAYHLPYPDNSFDVVLIQSILHHLDDPLQVIREAFRLAPEIVIHEPNGNNPGLKVIEKLSPYHREHLEKSYSTRQIKRWIEQAGGITTRLKFAGFVPMFCPDWLAYGMKLVEPIVTHLPVLRELGSAVYVVVAERRL